MDDRVTVRAGYPEHNPWLFLACPVLVGDAIGYITQPGKGSTLIIRDIEANRARKAGVADEVKSPPDFEPEDGLSADREVATAQSIAEFLRREGVAEVWTDRALPMVFAHEMQSAGVAVRCDPAMGVRERRMKSDREVELLRDAQRLTENAVKFGCEMIARATAGQTGVLQSDGAELTSECVIAAINTWLLQQGMGMSGSIVAGGADGGDCHNRGSGALYTGQPVIIDVFPQNPKTRYFGDCTRTVVHGQAPPEIVKMHAVVIEAKKSAIDATRAGVSGADVHAATMRVMRSHGYERAIPPADAPAEFVSIQHGTGHGVGIDVHEPPLLDDGAPELLVGECLTIEPGLYHTTLGGVRVEDMVIVRENGCDNLNSIHEGLDWT